MVVGDTKDHTHTQTGRTQGIASLELVYINCLATPFFVSLHVCVCVWLLNFLLLWLKYTQRCQLCEINTSTHSVVWPIWLRQSRLDALQGLGGRPGPRTNTLQHPAKRKQERKKEKVKKHLLCVWVFLCVSQSQRKCVYKTNIFLMREALLEALCLDMRVCFLLIKVLR